MAHGIGHHVQRLLGTSVAVYRAQRRGLASARALSVRQELHTDCFAGGWAHSTAKRELLERGDIVGGGRGPPPSGTTPRSGARVRLDRWIHGSSAQRTRWFERGLDSGDIDRRGTFSATRS